MENQDKKIELPTVKEYYEFQRLGLKLGIPTPEVFVSLKVEKDGKVLEDHNQISHTWNRNFWNYMICMLTTTPGVATNFGAGYLSFKMTNANVTAISSWAGIMAIQGTVGVSTWGIQVGIGTGAESFEGYVLTTPIVHGTGVNQLAYAVHSALAQSYNAGTLTWTITIKRLFNNNSAAGIGVNEVAMTWNYNNGTGLYMLNRDLLGATVTVAIGAQLTVTYLITLTLPA